MLNYEIYINMTKIKTNTKWTILTMGDDEGETDQMWISGEMYNATSILERLWKPKDQYIYCGIMSFAYDRQAAPTNSLHQDQNDDNSNWHCNVDGGNLTRHFP